MDSIIAFFEWLFGTRPGVITLMVGGVLLCALIAWLLERRTRARYYNHEKQEGDWDLFDEE